MTTNTIPFVLIEIVWSEILLTVLNTRVWYLFKGIQQSVLMYIF